MAHSRGPESDRNPVTLAIPSPSWRRPGIGLLPEGGRSWLCCGGTPCGGRWVWRRTSGSAPPSWPGCGFGAVPGWSRHQGSVSGCSSSVGCALRHPTRNWQFDPGLRLPDSDLCRIRSPDAVVYNLSASARRAMVSAMAAFWVMTIGFGLVTLLVPNIEFVSPFEQILPGWSRLQQLHPAVVETLSCSDPRLPRVPGGAPRRSVRVHQRLGVGGCARCSFCLAGGLPHQGLEAHPGGDHRPGPR